MAIAVSTNPDGAPLVVNAMAHGVPFPAPDYLPWRVSRLRYPEACPSSALVHAAAPSFTLGRGGAREPWPAGHPRRWTIAMTLVRPSVLGDDDALRLAADVHTIQGRAVEQYVRLYRRAIQEHGSLPAACAHLPSSVASAIDTAVGRRELLAALVGQGDAQAVRRLAPAYVLRAVLRQRRRGAVLETWRWLLPLAASGRVLTGAPGDLIGPYAGPPQDIPLCMLPDTPRAHAALALGLERFLQHALLALQAALETRVPGGLQHSPLHHGRSTAPPGAARPWCP